MTGALVADAARAAGAEAVYQPSRDALTARRRGLVQPGESC